MWSKSVADNMALGNFYGNYKIGIRLLGELAVEYKHNLTWTYL